MPSFDWTKYERLRDRGMSEHDVFRKALADGYIPLECVRMLKDVFRVDLMRAKEIYLQADGIANSVDEYQESLVPILEEAFREMDKEERELGGDG